jgi:hypothetical protein
MLFSINENQLELFKQIPPPGRFSGPQPHSDREVKQFPSLALDIIQF